MTKKVEKDVELEESRALKESMGFVVGKRMPIPKNWTGGELEELEFPDDLSRLTIDQLGELMGVWSTVMAFAQYEVARTDIDRTAKQNKLEFEKKILYLHLIDEGGMTEEQRKSEVYVRTAPLLAEYEVAKGKYTLVNALQGAYSKYYQALSRELSRRGLDGVGAAPSQRYEDEDDYISFDEEKAMITKEWQGEQQLDVVGGD